MELSVLIVLSLTMPIIFEWYILHFAPATLIKLLLKYNILKENQELTL